MVAFPGHDTAPIHFDAGSEWNRIATTVYRPNTHGAAQHGLPSAWHTPEADQQNLTR